MCPDRKPRRAAVSVVPPPQAPGRDTVRRIRRSKGENEFLRRIGNAQGRKTLLLFPAGSTAWTALALLCTLSALAPSYPMVAKPSHCIAPWVAVGERERLSTCQLRWRHPRGINGHAVSTVRVSTKRVNTQLAWLKSSWTRAPTGRG
jgi:hypothetical protein